MEKQHKKEMHAKDDYYKNQIRDMESYYLGQIEEQKDQKKAMKEKFDADSKKYESQIKDLKWEK